MRKGLVKGGLAAALDIGSSKVCCFIARADGAAMPRVIGIGQQASRGIKGGAIVDLEQAEISVLHAEHRSEARPACQEGVSKCRLTVSQAHYKKNERR